MVAYVVPLLHMSLWQKIFPGVKQANEKQGKMVQVAQERVAAWLKVKGERRDMREKLIEWHQETPEDMTVQIIEMEAAVVIFAGT